MKKFTRVITFLLKRHPRDIDKAVVIALIIKRGKVVEFGFNRRISRGMFDGYSIHAEVSALRKAGSRARGSTLMVYRIMKSGEYGPAKPCEDCERARIRAGVVWVEHT